MVNPQTNPAPREPLRLWPGVVAAALLVLVRFVVPVVAPKAEFFGMDAPLIAFLGGLAGALVTLVWWMLFSRARWSERLTAILVMVVAAVATRPLTHVSIQNGLMGFMFVVYAVPPTLSLALVAWAAASGYLSERLRRPAMVVAIAIGCGVWTLVRTNGVLGGAPDLAWRWTPTAEEQLLAMAGDEGGTSLPPAAPVESPPAAADAAAARPTSPAAPKVGPVALAPARTAAEPALSEPGTSRAEWPGFRGPARDGVARAARIGTDWSASPPVEMWRRPIGPGWSSFAVSGDLLYTQEQRGADEIVACYRASTGAPVWKHRDATRFWESNAGAGPRATPTLSGGRIYTFGASGIVNALDAATGRVVWSRNAVSDTGRQVPEWGFASSPLVVEGVVIVAVSGSLVGYDITTGQPRWFGPSHGGSYSSPHLTTIDGVAQVVLLTGAGATSVAPVSGELLWEHAWPGNAIVQPALTPDGDIVINTIVATGGVGTRRLKASHGSAGWTVAERWTSNGLKPYFNDFVVHEGHAFGFDGSILACIDLEDGKRKWKGGRYGNGQLVLLPDQDLLLVVSEEGEMALVRATPDQFTELARFKALEGKTWNHPVLVGDVLLVRNGEEMAAFRMR